jgi:hypothetical protein
MEGEACSVRSGAGEEGPVFGGVGEGLMGVFSVVCTCIGLRLAYL